MKKALRILGALVGLTVLGVVAAAIILPLVLDPNDYRERIAAEVEKRTGRPLTLAGPIGLSVFPWLGLSLQDATLGNAPGFGKEPFVTVQEARVKVRLVPLVLRRDLEVDTVVLREPRLHLAVNRKGKGNWEDLGGTDRPASPTRPPSGEGSKGGLGAVMIGGVNISAGEVVYTDARSGAITRLRKLDLDVGRVVPGKAVPVSARARVEASGPGVAGDVKLDTRLTADPATQRYRVADLALAATLTGEGLPKDGLPVELHADADADLKAGTAQVPKLRVEVLDAQLSGAGQITGLDDQPAFAGTLTLAPFSPRKVLEALGSEVHTADAQVLGKAQAALKLRASADSIEVTDLDARLDDTPATGTLGVANFAAPRVRFNLKLGALDLDRYLAPDAAQTPRAGDGGTAAPPAPTSAPAPAEPGLRLDELGARLGALDLSGTLVAQALKAGNVRMTDVQLTLRGKDGTVQADPLRAALYEGTLSGAVGLDARAPQPVLTLRQTLAGVSLGPLLKDLNQKESLTGRATLALDLRASGQVAAQLTQTLAGTVQADITDGVLKGVNVDRAICRAGAAMNTARGKDADACDPSPDSRFETFKASAVVNAGVLRNDDLLIVQPRQEAGKYYQVTGAGTVNLPRQKVDYDLRVARARTAQGETTPEERGRAIPVRVSGTFGDLSVRPDTRALATSEVKEQIKDRYGDRLETKENDSDLERQGKELLRGILGR